MSAALILPVIADFLQKRAADQQRSQQQQAGLASQYAAQQGGNMPQWGVQGQQNANANAAAQRNPMDYVTLFSKRNQEGG